MTSPNLKPEVVLHRCSNCDESCTNDGNNHITVIDMLFCISLSNCSEIAPPIEVIKKRRHPPRCNDVVSIFKMAAEFKGSM